LFTQIHEIVFHGKGGYDFPTVYNMPIWLRKFIYNNIQQFYKKEREEHDKAMSKSKRKDTTNIDMANPNKINIPDFIKNNPTYSSTVAKSRKK
tara:strand:+ start:4953 stop:5231 length:279 start_codon:yes stop_codon:yes gene_type:complete